MHSDKKYKYKKINTKIIIKVLLLIMLILVASISISKKSYGVSWEDSNSSTAYEYDLDAEGNAINVRITTVKSGNFEIPNQIDGHTVISLGDGVNRICGAGEKNELVTIQTFTLPDTVKKINAYAFKDCIVKNKSFNQIEEIGDYAFFNSKILSNRFIWSYKETLDLNSAKVIGNSAFAQDEISVLNETYRNLQYKYPLYKHEYTDIEFGDNLKEIGAYAFSRQGWLQTVNIPASTEKIGQNAFEICKRLKELNFDESRTLQLGIGDYAFTETAITNIEIKELYSLGKYVFSGSNINYAKIEDGVTKIEYGTFEDTDLSEIEIPSTLTEIGEWAFGGTLLDNEDYYYLLENSIESIGAHAFSGTKLSGEIIVPSKVKTLGAGVFSGCSNITTATIQMENVNKLPDYTFQHCTNLTTVNLPESITEIGNGAFSSCTSLDLNMLYNNILPSNKQNLIIGSNAFRNCTNLKGELSVPTNIISIGEDAFRGCTGLSGTLSIKDNLERIEARTFSECTNIEKIDLQPHETRLYIGDSAFEGNTKVESIILNGSVTAIGARAFANIPNAKEVKFNDVPTKNWTENIIIMGPISSIGSYAFYNTAVSEKIVRMSAPIEYLGTRIFNDPVEIFSTSFMPDARTEFRWEGDANPIIHQKGYHNIEVECILPGITVTDTDGNIANGQDIHAKCEQNFTLKFTISEEYADKYPNLAIKVISQGQYSNSDFVEEYITLDENNSYTFENITRDKKIIVQRMKDGTDLVLREFISGINNKGITARTPKIAINTQSAIPKFEYRHTKEPIIVEKNNIITYTIRVYNEGAIEGKADEITVRLPERLSFVENNSLNKLYEWTVSEDNEKVIKTNYLQDKTIEAYSGYGKTQNGRNIYGKPQYEELQIACKVEEPIDDQQYLVMVAEISDGNDIDSLPNDSDTIDLKTYMIEDSNVSDRNAYVKGIEDDTDHEILIMEGKTKVGYDLVINKIDLDTDELLDGAKMRLYDQNENIIKDVITQNGVAEFGGFCSYGEGVDTYYIEEVETPLGYSRTIDGKIKLEVIKVLNEDKEMDITIKCDVKEIETEFEDTNIEYIPVSTAEEFMKIGTGETVSVNGKEYVFAEKANYQLQNDIDFSEIPPVAPIKYVEGVFDGNGKKITGIKLVGTSTLNGIGLFQTYSGVIKRLSLDVIVDSTSPDIPGSIYEKKAVGGLVGYMVEGKIEDCNVSFITANGLKYLENIGGIIGHTHPDKLVIVKKCNAKFINYNSDEQNIGCIIGCVGGSAKIIECSNEGSQFPAPGNSAIGGFVGYSAEAGRVTFEKCTNKISFSGIVNVGGLIGCAMGGLSINECSNEGNIGSTNMATNAGGLVGYANPTKYVPKNVVVNFENDKLNVYITNKEKVDTYKINLLKVNKVDDKKAKLLDGAKFNIYNSKKELIQPGVETKDGVITIENLPLTSISNDTFYIQEIEAPKGYELVVKELVKVHVKPEWDGKNEKYIINSEIIIGEDNIGEGDKDNIEEGEIITRPGNSINVKWKNNNVIIENSYNYGTVLGIMDVGGIVGATKGDLIISNCHNMLNESKNNVVNSGKMNAGGIIGSSIMSTKDDLAEIVKCTNETTVVVNEINKSYSESAGGIIGNAITNTEITDCENNGSVIASNAGGIVGATFYKAIIDGCLNTGEVHASANAGGILGSTSFIGNKDMFGFYTENVYLEINNCTVKDVFTGTSDVRAAGITGNEHCAGIVGCTEALQSIITNCKVENSVLISSKTNSNPWDSDVSRNCAGGICGMFYGEEFVAHNNIVDKCDIHGTSHSAGILAGKGQWHFYEGTTSTGIKNMQINIDDCHVYGGQITSDKKKAAGILGDSDGYGTEELEVNINNCSVEKDDNNKATEITANGEMASGIYGGAYAADAVVAINLENNMVNGARITRGSAGNSSGLDVSGICAGMYGNKKKVNINIINCHVLNCELLNNNDGGYFTNSAGILSNIYSNATR